MDRLLHNDNREPPIKEQAKRKKRLFCKGNSKRILIEKGRFLPMQSKNSGFFTDLFFLTSLILIFVANVAYAEPGGSSKYLPRLWAIVFIGAALFSTIPWIVRKCSKKKRSTWVYLVASTVFAIVFLILFGPVIIALGNILLSGRTM